MNNVDTNPAKDFSDPISLISLLGFFLLSHFSRQFSSLFGLVVLLGIGFPLIWAFYTRNWRCLGFGKGKLTQALKWGIPAGAPLYPVAKMLRSRTMTAPTLARTQVERSAT